MTFSYSSFFESSIKCICFSKGVPAILPYFTNQCFFFGFHQPPAAWACNRIGMSVTSMRRGTSVSAAYRGGGLQADLSTTNSTDFNRCRDSSSYLKRTQTRESPYFATSLLVPGRPALRISRVFTLALG